MKKIVSLSFLLLLIAAKNFAQDKTIDSLKQVLKIANHDTTRCHALSRLSELADDGEWQKYNEQLKTLVETKLKEKPTNQSEHNLYKKYYADALNNIGINYHSKGDIHNAIIYYTKSLKIQEELDNKYGMASSLINIGNIYNSEGDVAKALNYFNKSLNIFKEIGNKSGIASCLNSIGTIYSKQNDIKKTLDYFIQSLKIREEIGDKKGIATSLNNIAVIYNDFDDENKALEYYLKSLKLREEIGDKSAIANSLNNIGYIYHMRRDMTKALDYYSKSLKIKEEIGDKEGLGISLNNIGTLYENIGDENKALNYYTQSLKVREEAGDQEGIATSFNNIGGIYLSLKNYSKALEYCSKSMILSKKLGFPEEIRNAAERLNKTYIALGNYKLGLQNYELFISMRDSITNNENKKASIKSQFKYEYEKKAAADSVKIAEEKKVVAVQLKQEKTQRFALYGGLVLVLIFAVFMFNRFRVTQKQKNIIELKEKETQQQNEIITIQKHLVEEKHKEITDSINYAERIQRSFLATKELLDENLSSLRGGAEGGGGYFVLFKPKDVVSGDFYWSAKLSNGNFALATADSTGHGVPGAIMSLLNVTSLEKAIEHYTNPADILNHTRQTIIERLKKDGSEEGGKDGMDCSLLVFDFANKQLLISAANNPVWIIRSNSPFEGGVRRTGDVELIEIKPDKMPVGKSDKQDQSFTTHTIELQEGDTIYTLTDGFPDQFGGDKGKKFMSKKLKELLLANVHLSIAQQKELLDSTFKNWVGDLEQVDDVTVIGIKV